MKLCIVIPCYNEAEVLPITVEKVSDKLAFLCDGKKISEDSRIVFVDDGSKDTTWGLIEKYSEENRFVEGLKLSRNRGHQNALLCGLLTVKDNFDAVISMDADLQDDIDAIDQMIDRYRDGCDVVYGVRKSRKKDSFFKKYTALGFYKLLNWMGAETVYNHADYRLLSRRALNALAEFKEVNLFLRGLVPLIGFKSDTVYYDRDKRAAGKTKYTFRKMLGLAFEGVTSLSVRPIEIIIRLGSVVLLAGLLVLIYSLVQHFTGNTEAGWTSIMASVWALGGLQLLAIGVIGKYIGKIYLEVKGRPRFIIEKNTFEE
ncbi:MAG: glycosyltransferase family 2 protein [Ruminococcaceae bacterium]|nr:glycosyltransferase family 2 protein [Oscillospiraceae bacterium]